MPVLIMVLYGNRAATSPRMSFVMKSRVWRSLSVHFGELSVFRDSPFLCSCIHLAKSEENTALVSFLVGQKKYLVSSAQGIITS